MGLLATISDRWQNETKPFLIRGDERIYAKDLMDIHLPELDPLGAGDTVALIGDFDPVSIVSLLRLVEQKCILVPLTEETAHDHAYFFDAAHVTHIVRGGSVEARLPRPQNHPLAKTLAGQSHPGLVLFSSGTTGRPKAILHDMTFFLKRFETPRPTLRTLNFLLFDHIGGLNTLLHTLFNRGQVVAPAGRSVPEVLEAIEGHAVELLPTTPTFLRMLLLSGLVPEGVPDSLKIITYGTERMDQPTLDALCERLPNTDFRQTFGMSELGILRVKSVSPDSLFMHVGGEGVTLRVEEDGLLKIRAEGRMLGYMNSDSPFDEEGWYDTKDLVTQREDGAIKVTGRVGDVINVGGQKFLPSEVERVALTFKGIRHAQAKGRDNPITGQHAELVIEVDDPEIFPLPTFKAFLKDNLAAHMVPRRVKIGTQKIGHRYKKL